MNFANFSKNDNNNNNNKRREIGHSSYVMPIFITRVNSIDLNTCLTQPATKSSWIIVEEL